MTRYFFSLLLAAGACLSSGAVNFNSETAGSLRTAFTDPENVLVLTVSGRIDASDLFYIDNSMPALTSLDLSGAEIVAYHGKAQRGLTEYAANTIPAGTLAGAGFTSISLPSGAGLVIGETAFAG
ncbi:MAG: hypothetical protein K2M06_00950, partial [Muribaculaceae bacterium]|nr:hypothetical protein [Muribaculaceae bacterium]